MKTKHLILPLAAIAMLCASCEKDNGASTKDNNAQSTYQEQDWDWNKQQGNGGFQIDTAWDGDTIFVNF